MVECYCLYLLWHLDYILTIYFMLHTFTLFLLQIRGWSDDWAVKNTCSSSAGIEFSSQHPGQVAKSLAPFSGLWRHLHKHVHVHTHNLKKIKCFYKSLHSYWIKTDSLIFSLIVEKSDISLIFFRWLHLKFLCVFKLAFSTQCLMLIAFFVFSTLDQDC